MSLKYEPASEPLHISVKYPTPYTLNPQPYTLHPTHYTLHTTHYTLHPTPSTQNSNHKYRSRCLTVAKRRLAEARRDPGTSISMIKWILTSRLSIKTLSLCRSRWLTLARRRLVEARRGPGNSTSYTLHPTLYTLHPTPYILGFHMAEPAAGPEFLSSLHPMHPEVPFMPLLIVHVHVEYMWGDVEAWGCRLNKGRSLV